jgi:hypothetical protein
MSKSINDYPVDGFPVPWATWIPGRRPEFKVHDDLGKAKNAIAMEVGGGRTKGRRKINSSRPHPRTGKIEYPIRGGVLYQLTDGKWTVRAVVQPGTYKSDHTLFTKARKWNKQPGITTVINEHPYEA